MVPMEYVTLDYWWNTNIILTRYKFSIDITSSTKITFMLRTYFLSILYTGVFPFILVNTFKFTEKIPSGNSSVSFISDTISFLKLDCCVVSLFPFMVNIDSTYATIFLSPLIYSISRPYASIISLHLNTLLVLKHLHLRFLWSVFFLNIWPSNIALNY